MTINPILCQFNDVDKDLVALLFTGLTKPDDKGGVAPDLAKGWQVDAEGRTYVFQLRPDVKWHDGHPFDADDVVFTVKALQDPEYQGSPDLAALWKNVVVEKTDALTVRFVLREPFAPFLTYTTIGILPAHLLASVPARELPTNAFRMMPVGTGMFKLTEATVEYAVLQRNDDFYGKKPYLSRIRLNFYADHQAAVAALQRKEVQGAAYLSAEDMAQLAANQNVNVYRSHRTMSTILYLNNKSPFFKDKLVRQALARAIDRDQVISFAVQGEAVPAVGPILPGTWAFDQTVPIQKHDPAQAGALLDQAGWVTGADGLRAKDGQAFVFSLMTNDDPTRIKTAEEIARQLRKVGIKAEVSASGYSGLLQNFLIPRRFDAIIFGWDNGFDPDGYSSWHSAQATTEGFNFASYSNKTVDELLEKGRQTQDENQRRQLYSEFQKTFADEVPSIFLYYPGYTYALDKTVRGVRIDLIDEPSARFAHIDEWYIKFRTERVSATQTKR